jgi:hypothetical protein
MRLTRKQQQIVNGVVWALCEYYSKNTPLIDLKKYVSESQSLGEYNNFDIGVEAVMRVAGRHPVVPYEFGDDRFNDFIFNELANEIPRHRL